MLTQEAYQAAQPLNGGVGMSVGEYLILFAAILIGLAVADLSMSLHKLLRMGRRLRWEPIVPALGFVVLCLILNLWWGLYRNLSSTTEITFLEFLPTVFMLLALFLLSAAVFPDEKLPEGASMKEYYLDTRQQIWGLFAFYLAMVMININTRGIEEGWSLAQFADNNVGNTIGLVGSLVLVWSRRMLLHWAMVAYWAYGISTAWFSARLELAAAG